MTQVNVHFETGREILNAYWGYLSGGGLTIARSRSPGLRKGQMVSLQVHIGRRRQFSISGRVARVGDAETVIAFDTSESQNRLLSAALSDKAIDMEARLTLCDMPSEATTMARLFELSEDGCCLRLRSEQGELFAIGAEVVIEAQGFRISGCVISARDDERCIIFGLGDNEAIEAVRACLHPHELH